MGKIIVGINFVKEINSIKEIKGKEIIKVFYKEGILEILEKYDDVEKIYIKETLIGNIELNKLIKKIKNKNRNIKIEILDKNNRIKEINNNYLIINNKTKLIVKIIKKIIKKESKNRIKKNINIINYNDEKLKNEYIKRIKKNVKIKIINKKEISYNKNKINIIIIYNDEERIKKIFKKNNYIYLKIENKNIYKIIEYLKIKTANQKIIFIRKWGNLLGIDFGILKEIVR